MKFLLFSISLVFLFASNAKAGCQNFDGHDALEFRFLLQGRTVEVKNANERLPYQSVFSGVNTGERIADSDSPYNGYTIFRLSNLFGGLAPQINMAFDDVDAFNLGHTRRAVLFLDSENGRQILHEFVCGADS